MWLEQSKGVREKGKKDRKFSSTCGTRTHDLLLSGLDSMGEDVHSGEKIDHEP